MVFMTERITRIVRTLEETAEVAGELLASIANSSPVRMTPAATVVGLSGDLGAGKTAFVKELGKQLGITDIIPSPTFVIMKEYAVRHPQFARLVHIDAYRLEGDTRALAHIGWEDILRDTHALVVVEWPEMIREGMPQSATQVHINLLPDGTRSISW